MAGGLFGKPFSLNIKCIIFSLICMALFLYKPHFNNNYSLYFTLFLIFVISYVAMAWYDYYFDCRILPLKRGSISLTGLFKPPMHEPDKQNNDSSNGNGNRNGNGNDRKSRLILIYLSHIVFIVPLITYIAIYRKKVNKLVYPILGVLAIFTLAYHGMYLGYNLY